MIVSFYAIFEDANEYEELNKIEGTSLYNNKQFKQESLQHSSSENRTKPIMIMDLWSAIHKSEKHSNIGFKREFEVSMLTYIQVSNLVYSNVFASLYVFTVYSVFDKK